MKKIKVLFLCVLVFALAIVSLGNINIDAATIVTSDKILVKGASARTADPAGLRFVATADGYVVEEGKTITSYGVALAYGKHEASDTFVKGGKAGGYDIIFGESAELNADNTFNICLIGIPTTQYDTYFTARAYVVLSDDTIVYGSTVTSRTLSQICVASKEAGVEGTIIDEVYNASTTVLNENGGQIVGEYRINMKQFNSAGNKEFGNYGVFTTKNNKPISNKYWNRVGINADPEYPGLYKVAAVNVSDDEIKTYDYAMGFHDKCLDTASKNAFYALVESGKALNYYVRINGVIPTEAGACDLTIDFDTNPEHLSETHHYGVEAKLPVAIKDYYDFQGWFNNPELTGNKIELQTADRNLYAKFTPTVYTITLELNGGANSATCPSEYNVESAEIILPTAAAMTKEGFTFGGWYDDNSFTGAAIEKIPAKSNGNKKLYAKWIAEKPLEVTLTEADKAAVEKINAENGKYPTIIVDDSFTGGKVKTTFGEYTCGTNAFTSLYAAFASGKVVDSDIIYLFAGEYFVDPAEIITINKGCIIAGPNYGIAGNGTRTAEANLNSHIDIKSSNVTLNGVTLSGYRRVLISGNLNNITFTNIIDTQTGEKRIGGRTAVIGMENGNTITNFVFTNNKAVISGGAGRNLIASYGRITNLTFVDNDITNGGTDTGYSECLLVTLTGGVYNINRNNIVWAGNNFTLMVGGSGNGCTALNMYDNTFAGGKAAASGLFLHYMDPGTQTYIVGNKFKNVSGNIFKFDAFPKNAHVHMLYNLFDEKTSYKVSVYANGDYEFVGNYYAAAQTTATPDYGKIKSEQELNDAYATYKASLGK